MQVKLKGCRPSQTILEEFSHICTNRGAAAHRVWKLNKEIEKFDLRLEELSLELEESRKQEAEIAAKEPAPAEAPKEEPTLEMVQ